MKPVLVFDYDGTLHETMRVYKPGIEGAVHWLRREHGIDVSIPSDQRIQSWLGMNTADMWEDFMPGLSASLRQQAGKLVGEIMLGEIRAGHARWYPGVTWNLDSLKHEGYTMVVLSNCEREYAELNWEVFGMERWFDAFYDCASYGYIPKEEIMKLVAAHYVEKSSEHKAEFVVIGDRGSDYAAAQSVGAPFIWCAYGYGSREEFVRETGDGSLSPFLIVKQNDISPSESINNTLTTGSALSEREPLTGIYQAVSVSV